MSESGAIADRCRTFTVGCEAGLCNRLRVLVSGLALAEASGRSFRMLWPRTVHCAASFQELFVNPLAVEEADSGALHVLADYTAANSHPLPGLLSSDERHITARKYSWLTDPLLYPEHERLLHRCEEILASLRPLPEIEDRATQFRRRSFRSTMIGVHVRRGDMPLPWRVATTEAVAATKRLLRHFPDAGILLCSDEGAPSSGDSGAPSNGTVRSLFQRRFGDRVVWTTPRSLDRKNPIAIQDALADLWLLRETDAIVASNGSSFSQLAAYGRTIPVIPCRGSTAFYAFLETAFRIAGIHALLTWDLRRRLRRKMTFHQMLTHYRNGFRRHRARLLKHPPGA